MRRSYLQTTKSRRFCIKCKKVTTFILDESINHSRCKFCKGTHCLNPQNKEAIANFLQKPMSYNWYKKAYQMAIEPIIIEKIGESDKRQYYEVHGKTGIYSVIYDCIKKIYLCTCQSKSYWGVNKLHCSHTKAVQIKKIMSTIRFIDGTTRSYL